MNNYRMTPLRDTLANKRRIIQNVEQQISKPNVKRSSLWRPIIVAAILLLFVGVSIPVIQEAFVGEDVTVERVEILGAEYPSLIQSQYVEETREILFEQQNKIFIYDIEQQVLNETVNLEDGILFDVQLTKDWLLYSHVTDEDEKVYALNRYTNETKVIDIPSFWDLNFSDNYVTYVQSDEYGVNQIMRYDLHTGETEKIQSVGEWDSLFSFIQEEKVIIFEQVYVDKQIKSTITVVDLHTLDELGQFETNFRSINHLQLRGDELFMLYIDQDMQKIGSYNLKTQQFEQLMLDEKIDDFATDGELFAVSVGNGGESKVKMYRRKGNKLVNTKALNDIPERTVRPRLQGSTFVINGETVGNPLYFIEKK